MMKKEIFSVESSDDTTIGLFNIRTFGVDDSSKLEEELGSKEGVLFTVSE